MTKTFLFFSFSVYTKMMEPYNGGMDVQKVKERKNALVQTCQEFLLPGCS
jgi:hypothetical protein